MSPISIAQSWRGSKGGGGRGRHANRKEKSSQRAASIALPHGHSVQIEVEIPSLPVSKREGWRKGKGSVLQVDVKLNRSYPRKHIERAVLREEHDGQGSGGRFKRGGEGRGRNGGGSARGHKV